MKPAPSPLARRLLEMLIVGILLSLGRMAAAELVAERPTLVVRLRPEATPPERERAIDEALLWAELETLELARRDPFVRHRVAANLAFIDDDEATARVDRRGWRRLYARAEGLDMLRRDPLLEAYLLGLMRRRVLGGAGSRVDATLGTGRAEAANGVDEIIYDHVFLGSDLSPDTALRAVERLREGEDIPSAPLLDHRPRARGPLRAESERWGSSVGAALSEAPLDEWRGPIESPFGFHFIRVLARFTSPGAGPSASGAAVASDGRDLDLAMEELRGRYRVQVVTEEP